MARQKLLRRLTKAGGQVEDSREWLSFVELQLARVAEQSGGGEEEKRTVQYTLRLTKVADGGIAWSHSHEIVKQQLIGAVYR